MVAASVSSDVFQQGQTRIALIYSRALVTFKYPMLISPTLPFIPNAKGHPPENTTLPFPFYRRIWAMSSYLKDYERNPTLQRMSSLLEVEVPSLLTSGELQILQKVKEISTSGPVVECRTLGDDLHVYLQGLIDDASSLYCFMMNFGQWKIYYNRRFAAKIMAPDVIEQKMREQMMLPEFLLGRSVERPSFGSS